MYSASELSSYSNYDLFIARNEIYARHGRQYNSAELRDYFERQPWYHGTITPSDFNESVLSSTERVNIDTIKSVEQARGSSYVSN